MKTAAARVPTSAGLGVVDAGVVLVRLDRRGRSHRRVAKLFSRSVRGEVALYLSVVNLAEVLQHGRRYSEATGLDLVAFVRGFRIELHSPDPEVAREVALLAAMSDLSLADRFAAATAGVLGARLYTTDEVLAEALTRRRRPVTRF